MTNENERRETPLDAGMVIGGFIVGLLVGGIMALLKAPQSGQKTRRQLEETGDQLLSKIEAVIPPDPIAQGLAEGKAAARRRQAELGLGKGR
ncbi:MAG: YtxH domain-containing protein [Chloroflexi bacterium]|nr:YtxH domain-containing protein [Chloroflexota bacterium]